MRSTRSKFRVRHRTCLRPEPLEDRRMLAQYAFAVNLYEDNGGTPGELIANDTVQIGDMFFLEITADDLRPSARGLGSLGLDIAWDPRVLEEIDTPFDPKDPSSSLVTPAFPLLRDGTLNQAAGKIKNLHGLAFLSSNTGRPIGIDGPERFALLRFQALHTAEYSPFCMELAWSGAGFVPDRDYTSRDLILDYQTITVVAPAEPSQVEPVIAASTGNEDHLSPQACRDETPHEAYQQAAAGVVNSLAESEGPAAAIAIPDVGDASQGTDSLAENVAQRSEVPEEPAGEFDLGSGDVGLVTADLSFSTSTIDTPTGTGENVADASIAPAGEPELAAEDAPDQFGLPRVVVAPDAEEPPIPPKIAEHGVGGDVGYAGVGLAQLQEVDVADGTGEAALPADSVDVVVFLAHVQITPEQEATLPADSPYQTEIALDVNLGDADETATLDGQYAPSVSDPPADLRDEGISVAADFAMLDVPDAVPSLHLDLALSATAPAISAFVKSSLEAVERAAPAVPEVYGARGSPACRVVPAVLADAVMSVQTGHMRLSAAYDDIDHLIAAMAADWLRTLKGHRHSSLRPPALSAVASMAMEVTR